MPVFWFQALRISTPVLAPTWTIGNYKTMWAWSQLNLPYSKKSHTACWQWAREKASQAQFWRPDFGLHQVPANCPHVCPGHSYEEHKVCSWEPWRSRAVIYLIHDLVQICLFKAVLCDLISCLENSCGLKSKESKKQEQLYTDSVQLQTSVRVATGHHILMMLGHLGILS